MYKTGSELYVEQRTVRSCDCIWTTDRIILKMENALLTLTHVLILICSIKRIGPALVPLIEVFLHNGERSNFKYWGSFKDLEYSSAHNQLYNCVSSFPFFRGFHPELWWQHVHEDHYAYGHAHRGRGCVLPLHVPASLWAANGYHITRFSWYPAAGARWGPCQTHGQSRYRIMTYPSAFSLSLFLFSCPPPLPPHELNYK